MNFEDFKQQIGTPLFDTIFARQALSDYSSDEYLAVQFTRWAKSGKLIKLRRGLYALPGEEVSALAIANHLVAPSYVSGEFALSWYGLIPDAAWTIISACLCTPRVKTWKNPYGTFDYHQVKLYEGFRQIEDKGVAIYIAEPEKALLDSWYWQLGEWTKTRHLAMRYQELSRIDLTHLEYLAERFQSPRMMRAYENFRVAYDYLQASDEGSISL